VKVRNIEISSIEQNENSRVIYKASDLSELMHSMKKDGQLQPVGVRPLENGKFDAVFGNRRIIAAKKLGWSTIDAVILDGVTEDRDRDILNLVENLKRQNTTVAEDGRMFCVLRDYGLSVEEIAVRLDVNVQRVQTAIEVYSTVPKEYHASIVNRTSGKKIKGKISASAAHQIMNLRRSHGLNRKQTRKLLDFARDDDTSLMHVGKVAPLMKAGLNLSDALKTASSLERIALFFFMDRKLVARLEKKHGCPINEVLLRQLEKNSEIKIQRTVRVGIDNKTRQHRASEQKAG
jgi:ParB/RepB/Spo0J family partition protein